jgi:hypothetical protein
MLSRKFSKGSFFSLISDMSVDLDLFFSEILGSDGNVIRILAFRTLLDEIEGRSPNRPVLEPLVMEGCETRQKMNSKPFTFDEHTPKALRETKSVYLSKKMEQKVHYPAPMLLTRFQKVQFGAELKRIDTRLTRL